jgi:hypothetical protein
MSDNDVVVRFTSEEADLWRGMNRVISAHVKQATTLDDVAKRARGADAELQRFAKRTKDIDATPLQRWQTEFGKLKGALAGGLLTQDEYAKGLRRIGQQFKANTTVIDQEAEALKRFGDQTRQKYASPLETYNAEMERLQKALKSAAIDQETFNRAKAAQDAILAKSTTTVNQEAEALKRFAQSLKEIHVSPLQTYNTEIEKTQKALQSGLIDEREFNLELARQSAILQRATGALTANEDGLHQVALRIREINATPLQKYEKAITQAQQAMQRGHLTQAEFNIELARQVGLLTQSTTGLDANAIEMKRLSDEIRQLNLTPLDKYNASIAKINAAQRSGYLTRLEATAAIRREREALDKTTAAANQAGGSLTNAFVSQASGYVAGIVSIAGAVDFMRNALAHASAQADKTIQSLEKLEPARKRSAQIATSAEDLEQLETQADKYAIQYGVDRATVRNLMFSARSEGFEESVPKILGAANVVDPMSQATIAGQVKQLFPRDKITANQTLNAALVASAESRLDYEEMARAMPQAAEGANLAGSSTAETMAVLGVMSSRFKSGDVAADRMKHFGVTASLQEGLKGKGIVGAFNAMQAMPEDERKEILGDSQELNAFYQAMSEETEKIAALQKKVERAIRTTGTSDDTMDAQVRMSTDSSTDIGRKNNALRSRNRAQIADEVDAERRAVPNAQREQAMAEVQTKIRQERPGVFNEYVGVKGAELGKSLQVSPKMTKSISEAFVDTKEVLADAALGAIPGSGFFGGGFSKGTRKLFGGGQSAPPPRSDGAAMNESADKLKTAADKLSAAADRITTMAKPGLQTTRPSFAGPARAQAAIVPE